MSHFLGRSSCTFTALGNRPGDGWSGDRISHADIILATMLRFLREALAGVFDLDSYPALAAHAARCDALPVFETISQPYRLVPPSA